MASSSKSSSNCSTASQAWAILKRHARDEIMKLRLIELCQDNDRVSSLVSVYNATPPSNSMLMIDLSRQRMTIETLNHLLRLASSRSIAEFIRQLSWGQNNPDDPILPIRFRSRNKDPQSSASASSSSYHGEYGNKKNKEFSQRRQQQRNQQQKQNQKHQNEPSLYSSHMSLRVPSGQNFEMLAPDGTNALVDIHNNWDRIRRISESLRRGKLPGVTGGMIKDVVVVGRGLAIMALRFTYLALCKDEAATIARRAGMDGRGNKGGGGKQQRRMKFLTTVDPIRAATLVVADSDPASTLVISIALAGEEEATMLATQTLQTWLLVNLGGQHGRLSEVILSKHTMMVTGNKELAAKNEAASVFVIPDHCCEPYTTFTAASLLPLSIVFGWPIVEAFLAGGHDIDSHFVETNPRHNLPVLLALTDIWNDCLQSSDNSTTNAGRIVTPYTEAFAGYPAFVAALESQICGRKKCDNNDHKITSSTSTSYSSSQNSSFAPTTVKKSRQSTSTSCSSIVIDGGLHGIYDRSLYQASKVIPSELVMTLDSQLSANGSLSSSQQHQQYHKNKIQQRGGIEELHQSQDALIVSLFAHADELAFGSENNNNNRHNGNCDNDPSIVITGGGNASSGSDCGNRPSTILLCSKLDAFTCGQLVAMAEHRAVVKAWIWEIDPFQRIETKTVLRSKRTESLKESLRKMIYNGDDDDNDIEENEIGELNLSTRTILRHYANMVRGQRTNTK